MSLKTLLTIALLLFLASSESTGETIRVPQDQAHIQDAVQLSAAGDTVLVSDGSYEEVIAISGKDITLTSVSGAASTIIDGSGEGPVLYLDGSSSLISGFTITGGASAGDVGGVRIQGAAEIPEIRDCIIDGNSGSSAGGLLIKQDTAPVISGCVITGNTASGDGGGIRIIRAEALLERNIIAWNTSTGGSGGGIVVLQDCSPEIINNSIFENHSGVGRGALTCNVAFPEIINNIIAANTGGGGGIRCENGAYPQLSYNDVWSNGDVDYYGCAAGVGSISGDPLFEGGFPFDFNLSSGSPCIDAGDPVMDPPPLGGYCIDIGAVEVLGLGGALIRVPADYPAIQAAIDVSEDGDTVLVAAGIYQECLDLKGRSIVLISEEGASSTIVNARDEGAVLTIIRGETSFTLVRGFTFKYGFSESGCGGINIYGSSPVLRDNEILFCTSAQGGGLKISGDCSPRIDGNLFSHNTSSSDGGGALISGSHPDLIRNRFYLNSADGAGGGVMYRSSAGGSFVNNSFHSNESTVGRGCVTCNNSFPVIRNSIIVMGTGGGGGLRVENGGDPAISYNCIWGNSGGEYNNCEPGPGDISKDPFFKGGSPYDFHLQSEKGRFESGQWVVDVRTSPAIDAGDPGDDFALEVYPNGGRINMGAYGGSAEASLSKGDRLLVPNDFDTIQDAVDFAGDGDTVIVDGSQDPYRESITIDGVAVTIRAWDMDVMPIIDASGLGRAITVTGASDTARLEGLEITGGDATRGGGVKINYSNVMIDSCRISGNSAVDGAGMHISGSSAVGIINTHILDNNASSEGGGIYCENSEFLMRFCVVARDTAGYDGGAIFLYDSSPGIFSSTLDHNLCDELERGGGISCTDGSDPIINSCIVSYSTFGYGLFADTTSAPIATFSDFYMNFPSGDFGGPGDPDCYWACIRDNPRYREGDPYYYLRLYSPCVNAGDPGLDVPEGGGACIDMGAYEFLASYGGVLRVPDDFDTIQEAVDAATEGDTVLVSPGTYFEHIVWDGVPIYLKGAAGAGATVIDGSGVGRPITVSGVSDTLFGIKGFTIRGGYADMGAGIYMSGATIRIHDCEIVDNQAVEGGGVYLADGSSARLYENRIADNRAQSGDGGGIYVSNSVPRIFNNLLIANSADLSGGALYIDGCSPIVRNNLFWMNGAGFEGGAILCTGGGSAAIKYNIIGQTICGYGVYGCLGNNPQIAYNDFWENYPGDTGGSAEMNSGNISEGPLFVGGNPFDYHLKSVTGSYKESLGTFTPDSVNSPCIDRGNSDFPVLDEPVPNGDIINIGPYGGSGQASLSSATIIRVPGDVPFIQTAIDEALEGDIVLVDPGIYSENLHFKGLNIEVRSTDGPDITVLNGSLSGSVVVFDDDEERHCILDGFSITGGLAETGGGIYIDSEPTIRNCNIFGNETDLLGGGGIFIKDLRSPLISLCGIFENYSVHFGGGIYSENAEPVISDCFIYDNTAETSGGGISLYNKERPTRTPIIEDNRIQGNIALANGGGGIMCENSDAIIRNNRISGNQALYHGGGVYLTGNPSMPEVTGNILLSNSVIDSVSGKGGGIAVRYTGTDDILLESNVYYLNIAPKGSGIYCQSTSVSIADNILMANRLGAAFEVVSTTLAHGYNDYYINEAGDYSGCQTGIGDFQLNPVFIDTLFNLGAHSPCIDAGCPLLTDETDGSVRDVGAISFTHTMYLTLYPESFTVSPGENLRIDAEVVNPDFQPQRAVLTLAVEYGLDGRLVLEEVIVEPAADETLTVTFNELVPAGTPPRSFFVRGSLVVEPDYLYGSDGFYLTIE